MSNLLEKASIITTPTAYSDGVLHSVKPSESPYADFTFTRNNPGTRVNASGNIESIGVDLPRIDYRGGSGSLLLEPQATNTATDSNDFSQGTIFVTSGNPSLTSATLTSAQATSPDGTNNAWKLADNNDGNTGQCSVNYFNADVISENYNTVSLFVKKQGDNDWMYINNVGYDTASRSWFNISNGTLGTVASGHTASIDDYGNGWYRIAITFTTEIDLNGGINIRLATSNNDTLILRDGTNGAYIYGLQAESHATRQYATSYIPTSGSPQTRGEDLAASAGSSDLISSTEGVLYAEIAALSNNLSHRRISLSDGTLNNLVYISFDTNSNTILVNANGKILNYTVSDETEFHKVAVLYNSTAPKLFINGVLRETETAMNPITALNQVRFDGGVGNNRFIGKVKCVAVFKEALTDSELTCLTTPNISRIFNDRVLWDGGIIESLECVTL